MKRLSACFTEAWIRDTWCSVKNGCFHIETAERRAESWLFVAKYSGSQEDLYCSWNCWFKVVIRPRRLAALMFLSSCLVVGTSEACSQLNKNSFREKHWMRNKTESCHADPQSRWCTFGSDKWNKSVKAKRIFAFLLCDSCKKKGHRQKTANNHSEWSCGETALEPHHPAGHPVKALNIFWLAVFSGVCFCLAYWFPRDDSQRWLHSAVSCRCRWTDWW